MAAILELEVTDTKAHIQIDGREYLMIGGTAWVTVLAGKWITNRRALGKTFHRLGELARHYKQDGATLAAYAAKLASWSDKP